MTVAIRMLAYGMLADAIDEYVRISESTTIESLKRFCAGIISIYREEYLRLPTEADIFRLLREGEKRGFPGISHNDINILDQSYFFAELIEEHAPSANYTINGNQYTTGYCLADGIYLKWATLVQMIS
ncbi:uncharacterized protein LOC132296489 [Cornus florida]|uniref:uncharacterized protein LOC132296489 n=1 Tax=Cornus florida TaxID=4283 RepID=UPI0028A2334B|nr:uncharacterized protein LOC132296489 [Cornus florida]